MVYAVFTTEKTEHRQAVRSKMENPVIPITIGGIIILSIVAACLCSWCWGSPSQIKNNTDPHLSPGYSDVHYVRFHVVDHNLNPMKGVIVTADTKMKKPDVWMITSGITNEEGYADLVLDETIRWDITLSNQGNIFHIYPGEMEYFFVSDDVYIELTTSEVM